jgi:hypothetical protein
MKTQAQTQMDKDLRNQLNRKLRVWVSDAFDLYEMAELPPATCVASIICEMSQLLAEILKDTSRMTPQKFGALMEKTFATMLEVEEKAIIVQLLHPDVGPDVFGEVPEFLDPTDPRPAREQFNERYAHGGGWRPMKGWRLSKDNVLQYSYGDSGGEEPPLRPLAQTKLRKELIVLYEHSWVAIIQEDRTFEVSRMD